MTTPTTPLTLVLGPSLGTTVHSCWGPTIERLAALAPDLEIVGFELPGHASDDEVATTPLTIAHLATQVLDRVEGAFVYAGDSVGGQLGIQLLLEAPDRVLGAVLCCTAARIGTAESWQERAEQVRTHGTSSLIEATAQRWFGPGFDEREPELAGALLDSLRNTDDDGYVAVCGALGAFDARELLDEIEVPVVVVAGSHDTVCTPELMGELADGLERGRLVVLDGVGHQAPAEAPDEVARLIVELAGEVGKETG